MSASNESETQQSVDVEQGVKEEGYSVVWVSLYLLGLLSVPFSYFIACSYGALPTWLSKHQLLVECVLFGLIGGCLYCLRAVYLNRCVRKSWDTIWLSWYVLRPLVSLIMGGMTYFMINVGLIAIGGKAISSPEHLFYILAFFSGLNVDGFLKKFEGQISKTTGVRQSKQSSSNSNG